MRVCKSAKVITLGGSPEKTKEQYADDRYDTHLDGIPFIEPIDAIEMLARLNELESSKELRLGDVYV